MRRSVIAFLNRIEIEGGRRHPERIEHELLHHLRVCCCDVLMQIVDVRRGITGYRRPSNYCIGKVRPVCWLAACSQVTSTWRREWHSYTDTSIQVLPRKALPSFLHLCRARFQKDCACAPGRYGKRCNEERDHESQWLISPCRWRIPLACLIFARAPGLVTRLPKIVSSRSLSQSPLPRQKLNAERRGSGTPGADGPVSGRIIRRF